MSTPYQRLTRLRERAVEVRDSLPIGSVEGEFYTDYIDLIDEALLEVVRPEPEKDETDETKPLVKPEPFDINAEIRRLFLSPAHMGVVAG